MPHKPVSLATHPPRQANWLDAAGITASLTCLAHCLLLPVILALLPAPASSLTVPEEVHLAAFCFAIPASGWAILGGYRRHGVLQPVIIGAVGLASLGLGLVGGSQWMVETGFTVAGSILLTTAHVQNWRLKGSAEPSTDAEPQGQLRGTASGRILSIDALRGVVMLLMLVDHVRKFFYLHAQVADPMDVSTTSPGLFASRILAHLCAPIFVALTGLSAWLYGQSRGGKAAASAFLFKRGLFLIALELTVVSFAWTFSLPPQTLFLQVIWVIGLSMIALSALLWLPRYAVLAIGIVIVLGHNLLDPITFAPGEAGHAVWAVLHDRGYIELTETVRARTSYPLLPWIGVIALGWSAGPWFGRSNPVEARRGRLLLAGFGALALFILLRSLNIYGDAHAWHVGASALQTAMSFLNVTKYPPSADFVLLTLGVGALLLLLLEKAPDRTLSTVAIFGAAPLFFYVVHLYLLHALNLAALAAFGANHGAFFSLPGVAALWLLAAAVAAPLWFLCRWFVGVKRRSGNALLSYL